MKRNALLVTLVAVAAAIAGVAAGSFLLGPQQPAPLSSGTRLNEPRPLPEFDMTAHDGSAFSREDMTGHWSLVFFGFTHCPDVCPNTLFMLDRAVEQVAAADAAPPEVVFVSVDTERDTPEKMAEYVNYFNPAFVGVVGDGNNLQKLTQAMSVAYEFKPEGDSYTVIHSSTVLAVDPQGRLRAIFTPPLKADAIAADVLRLVSD